MKNLYAILAIVAALTIIRIETIGSQQIYAPKECGQYSAFKKLTNEFEKKLSMQHLQTRLN
ncbi:MAG TPA: hypothetical protein VH797_07945 [Nitrososphaeraceae archaeon]|jgi:hypothetical protein